MKAFFVNLYKRFINLSWVSWTIDYCRQEPIMACIVGGTLLFLFIVLCAMCKKRKKAKRAQKAALLAAEATIQPIENEEETPAEKTVATQAAAPAPVEETKASVAPTTAEPTPVKEEAAIAEVKAPAPAKKPVEKTVTKATPKAKPAPVLDKYEENETDKAAKYAGKWNICRVLTDVDGSEEMFFFELRASNGEKLLASEEYTTYQGALRGIETHKTNLLNRNMRVTVSKKGDYIFKLLNGKNMLLCMGEHYPTKARCESAMESAVRFAETAVVDESVQDIIVKAPKEEEAPSPTLPDGHNGKWVVSTRENDEGNTVYSFDLYANNGVRLLSGEEYTTYTGAVNGISTHKKNIEKDNFRISLTKRGDYIYKLLNGNGQLLCLGEHYKTRRLCQNAVESVKRFALNSPVLTEEKKK